MPRYAVKNVHIRKISTKNFPMKNFKILKGSLLSSVDQGTFQLIFFKSKKKNLPRLNIHQRKCIVCNEEISEHTLFSLLHTKCCSKHLDHNPTVIPKLDEPLGTREDFKRDSASNWVRSKSSKF